MTGARERIHSPCLGHEIPPKGCTISASIHIGKHVFMCVAGFFFKLGLHAFSETHTSPVSLFIKISEEGWAGTTFKRDCPIMQTVVIELVIEHPGRLCLEGSMQQARWHIFPWMHFRGCKAITALPKWSMAPIDSHQTALEGYYIRGSNLYGP